MRERLLWLLVVVLAMVAAVTTTLLVTRDDGPDARSKPEPTPAAITERVTVVCGASASERDCTTQADTAAQEACMGPHVRAVELTQSSPSAPAPITRTVVCDGAGG